MKRLVLVLSLIILLVTALPSHASDQVTYLSQPEQVAIFLNNIALARDTINLGGEAAVSITLPDQVFPDTLILRENGQRVTRYSLSYVTGKAVVTFQTSGEAEITLDYLFAGLSWRPTYDMWIVGAADDQSVQMSFFVEIQNNALSLEDVAVRLVAGRVDTSQQVYDTSVVTANQYIAGYEATGVVPSGVVGPVTIQHVYEAGTISAAMGDTLYLGILDKTFPARRLILWNAATDIQAQVIYKVTNDSDLPLAEGITRTYQDDLFIGSDFIETTPIGSEGSVTVGGVQDLRVNRAASQTYLEGVLGYEYQHEVTLTLSSFSDQDIQLEVVDYWDTNAKDFEFSQEPSREPGNLLRWAVTVPAGETIVITYRFRTD
jgi:hypothetical protein